MPRRRPSSRARSTETPRASPSSFCASTGFPKLIAARSFPVGAISFASERTVGAVAQASSPAPKTASAFAAVTLIVLLAPGARLIRCRSMMSRIPIALLCFSLPAAAASRSFSVDSKASNVRLHVGKTGIGSFAGHEHNIVAPSLQGEVNADLDDLPKSTVEVLFNARAMECTPEGEPDGDAPKVTQTMRGPSVLNAARFAVIRFRSQKVSGKKI